MNRCSLLAVAALLGLSACSKAPEAAAPASSMPQSMALGVAPNSGKLLKVEQAGGYTYGQVDMGNGRVVWVAGGPLNVKAGDSVQWGEYSVMRNFNAKSLGRTFDEILFVNAWGPVGGAIAQVAPHGVAPGQAPAMPAAAGAPAAPGASGGKVKSVATAGGYSYLEVAQGDKTIWVAVVEMKVKAGDEVRWSEGTVMQNFNSKSLGRTFDQIVFAGGASVVK